jgi:hypothetical protein
MKNTKSISISILLALAAVLGTVYFLRDPGAGHPVRSAASVPAISTAATPADTDEAVAPPVPLRYPTVVGRDLHYSDNSSLDESVPFRVFSLPISPATEIPVTSAYQAYFDAGHDLQYRIELLADLNSGFTEYFAMDFPATGSGAVLRLHVGDFAQDNCGPVVAVYSLQTPKTISMTVGDAEILQQLFQGAHCTLDIPTGPETCATRSKCLTDFLRSNPPDVGIRSPTLTHLLPLEIQ